MQIQFTFDTTNKADLSLLSKVMNSLEHLQAQPEVANTGTTEPGAPFPSGVSSVTGAAEEAAPAPVIKKGRKVVKEAAAEPLEDLPELKLVPKEDAPASDKPLTLDEVRAALQTFTAANGVPAGIELLKTFEAGRISELAEEKYAEFVAACAV